MRNMSSRVAVFAAVALVAGLRSPAATAAGASAAPGGLAHAAAADTAAAAAEVATMLRAFLAPAFVADWRGIEALRAVEWTPLPPRALQECLPDGGCFVRVGTAHFGGRPFGVLASGSRDGVAHLHLQGAGEPIGDAVVLAALRRAGLAAEPARCPPEARLPGQGADAIRWYRVVGAGAAGALSVRTSCDGRACEAYAVSREPAPDGGRCGAADDGARRPAAAAAPWREKPAAPRGGPGPAR